MVSRSFVRRGRGDAAEGSRRRRGGVAPPSRDVAPQVLRLAPGGRIVPHAAPTNARLKAHLGLEVPPAGAATLTVADEARAFANGTVLVFDDSFFHEAANAGEVARYVLSVDFWKPGLFLGAG